MVLLPPSEGGGYDDTLDYLLSFITLLISLITLLISFITLLILFLIWFISFITVSFNDLSRCFGYIIVY